MSHNENILNSEFQVLTGGTWILNFLLTVVNCLNVVEVEVEVQVEVYFIFQAVHIHTYSIFYSLDVYMLSRSMYM